MANAGTLKLDGCTVSGNTAALGGGVYLASGVTYAKVEGTSVTDNTATSDAAAADEYQAA